jgi:hypothetical protein
MGQEKPGRVFRVTTSSIKIEVRYAISRKRIVGPIFFENTINSQEHLRILQEFIPELDEEEMNECYYQQDGASHHTSQLIAPNLTSYFGDRIISRSNKFFKTAIDWSPVLLN